MRRRIVRSTSSNRADIDNSTTEDPDIEDPSRPQNLIYNPTISMIFGKLGKLRALPKQDMVN
jgi:hypothetical protein